MGGYQDKIETILDEINTGSQLHKLISKIKLCLHSADNIKGTLFLHDIKSKIDYKIFGEHNKPTGYYTGNATARTISTGGIGNTVMIREGTIGDCILTPDGGFKIVAGGAISGVIYTDGKINDGVITLSASCIFNKSSVSYYYQIL